MIPSLTLDKLKKSHAWEHALRFVFGGSISVAASVIAEHWGPGIGGLFLAFPALLPASLTLLKEHDGRAQAVDDARGARLGALGLCFFAALVRLAASAGAAISLLLGTLAWAFLACLSWYLVYGRNSSNR